MEIYHVLNRGVEKRDVVLNDDDRMRFVRSLYIFNDENNAPNSIAQPKRWNKNIDRIKIVHIHAWCLMNNHYHLLLSPVDDDIKNISLFMKKLNMGYAKFFNEKYERSGYLWQGKYKKIHINNSSQFQYIPYYVHLNSLDYYDYSWRKGGINTKQFADAKKYLENYRWSSYFDYNNVRNFPSIIDKGLLSEILLNPDNQDAQIKSIISGNVTQNETSHTTFSDMLEV